MTARNLVAPEQAEINRERYGALTFNSEVPRDYHGVLFIIACVRLGDHAHLDIYSGRQHSNAHRDAEPSRHYSGAGKLILRWHEWVVLRDLVDSLELPIVMREVEKPTRGQLDRHLAPEVSSDVPPGEQA